MIWEVRKHDVFDFDIALGEKLGLESSHYARMAAGDPTHRRNDICGNIADLGNGAIEVFELVPAKTTKVVQCMNEGSDDSALPNKLAMVSDDGLWGFFFFVYVPCLHFAFTICFLFSNFLLLFIWSRV